MRTYHGKRTNESTQVLVNADDLTSPSPLNNTFGDGKLPFDWGYEGESPAVLAHSLLVDAVGLLSIDVFFEQFMADIISQLDFSEWTLTQSEILEYAKQKYLDDNYADMSKNPQARADEALQNTVGFVKEMQALSQQSDLSQEHTQERLLCDSEDEKAFSPWYHFHPQADRSKDQIIAWLKECEDIQNNE